VRRTLHKAPHHAVSCSALFPRIYLVQNFFQSTLFSNLLTQYSSMWDIRFHAHVKQQVKLRILSINFWIQNRMIKYSLPKGSKYSSSSICSWFVNECNFDLLGLFPDIVEFCHILKDLFTYHYLLIWSCIPFTGHWHILRFLCIYF